MLASKTQPQLSGTSPNRNYLHYSNLGLEPKGEPWYVTQAVSKVQEPLGALTAGLGPGLSPRAPVFSRFLRQSPWPLGQRLVLERSEGNVDQRRAVLLGSSLYWLFDRNSKAVICPALPCGHQFETSEHLDALKQGANRVS